MLVAKSMPILLGFSTRSAFGSYLFGSISDSVLWSAHCLVAIARLVDSPLNIKRILVPVEDLTSKSLVPVQFAKILTADSATEVTLLHVCPPRTSKERKNNIHTQLESISKLFSDRTTVDIKVTSEANFVRAIIAASRSQELVILRSQRHRIGADGLALSPTAKPLLKNLKCLVILLGEP